MKTLPPRRLARLPARPARCSVGGYALIEVLVSLLLFSFGVLGLIGLEAAAINYSVDAEDRTRAAVIANEISSSMWLSGSVAVSAASLAAWKAIVANPSGASVPGVPNGVLAVNPVANTTNAVDIVITWKPPYAAAGDSSDTLTTRVILP